ncbi:MAG: amidohydrolase family protein, partial [bacterium]|nr:amidohydrolase family protein [bacterium]
MIIDAHTHIFPDQLAAEYLSRTAQTFNVPTYGLATAKDLLQQMDRNGVDYAVVHMVAPAPSGVRSTNDWLIDLQCERFIKSATLHPLDKNYQDEIQRLKDNNISIVKFQPDVQQFYPDDKKTTYGLYEALADNNIRVMFHVGGEPMPGPNDRSKPHMIKKVALDFPELTIVA